LFIGLNYKDHIIRGKTGGFTTDYIPAIIDTPEALEAKIAAMKEAQKLFATYTQEQVDKIFKAAATAADKARIPLAKAAVEETGMGIVEDKVIKNHYASDTSTMHTKTQRPVV
jgi:acyl-CoA reductase-like NAD-dependent aldehyde dehydrogenase